MKHVYSNQISLTKWRLYVDLLVHPAGSKNEMRWGSHRTISRTHWSSFLEMSSASIVKLNGYRFYLFVLRYMRHAIRHQKYTVFGFDTELTSCFLLFILPMYTIQSHTNWIDIMQMHNINAESNEWNLCDQH